MSTDTATLPARPPLVDFDRDAAREWLTAENDDGEPRYFDWLSGTLLPPRVGEDTPDLSGMELALHRVGEMVADAEHERQMFGPYDPLLIVEGEGFVVTVNVTPWGDGALRLSSGYAQIEDLSLIERATADGYVPVPLLDQALDVLEHTADEVNKAIVRGWEGLALIAAAQPAPAPVVVVAELDTRTFVFQGVGVDEANAVDLLRKAWATHRSQYVGFGVPLYTWAELVESVQVRTLRAGEATRDRERLIGREDTDADAG